MCCVPPCVSVLHRALMLVALSQFWTFKMTYYFSFMAQLSCQTCTHIEYIPVIAMMEILRACNICIHAVHTAKLRVNQMLKHTQHEATGPRALTHTIMWGMTSM